MHSCGVHKKRIGFLAFPLFLLGTDSVPTLDDVQRYQDHIDDKCRDAHLY